MKNPSVRYWKSRGAYCCWINRVQHVLAKGPKDGPTGPTFLAAAARFNKLLSLETNKGTDEYLVSSLLNQYRIYLRETRKGSPVPGIFEVMARGFAEEFGHLRVCDLKPYDFDAWLSKQTQWNPTSKAHAVALVLASISWARRKGYIQTDPLVGKIDRPQAILRGREARMSEEFMDLLIAECFEKATYNRKLRTKEAKVHIKKSGFCEPFGRLLWLLRLTGARPVELRKAEAHNYHNGRLVFRWNATKGYKHKTSAKTQRDRIIFIPAEAQEYVESCIEKYPSGPIFRTLRGEPWTLQNCANKWRRWLLQRPKVVEYLEDHEIDPKEIRMYNFRHTAISSFLDNGGDIYAASQIFGTGVKMIERRYGHPNIDRLQEQFHRYMPTIGRSSPSMDEEERTPEPARAG